MIVGVMTVEVALLEVRTLKEKRRIVQSAKQRLRDAYNVSVAEVDHLDSPKRCTLGVALVCNESRPIHAQFDRMMNLLRGVGGLSLIRFERELL